LLRAAQARLMNSFIGMPVTNAPEPEPTDDTELERLMENL